MSDTLGDDAAALLARAAKLKLFVILRRVTDPAGAKAELPAHLRWMISQEQCGKVFLSGPIAPHDGEPRLDGLTIIRADDIQQAAAIIDEDPPVKSGFVDVEIREWTLNEGGISLFLTLSDSSVRVA